MDKKIVYSLCQKYGSPAGIDPLIKLAIVQRESSFDPTGLRMEDGFQERYMKHRKDLPTSASVLLSTSYGLTQMMGESLAERGFFQYFIGWHNAKYPLAEPLKNEKSQLTIVKGIDEYAQTPEWHIEWGVKHLLSKLALAKGDMHKALLFWNGGGNPHYPDEVLLFREQLSKEFA